MTRHTSSLLTGVSTLFLAGLLTVSLHAADKPASAFAELKAAQGQTVSGKLEFIQEAGAVHVSGDVQHLSPGKHGMHVHDKADLSAPDLASAGGHFNPTKEQHGAPDAEHHHTGDFGNITADENGTAHVDLTIPGLSLTGANSIIGHSIIIHGGTDDLKSQPAGNSGPRVAGGVIEASASSQ
ncbi:MAG TPA: superoxide dismutase family protein [Opitutaceae bacterium]